MPARTTAPTSDVLVRAARKMFARHGYDGASIRAITRAAGANLGAVTYHFGSKRNLYGRVLADVFAPLGRRIEVVAAAPTPPLDRVDAVIGAFFDHFVENPDMPHLMLQEIAAGRPPPDPVAHTIRSTMAALTGVIRDGQADGSIREGEPLMMALSIVAQPVYLTLVSPIARRLLALDQRDPAVRRAVVEHATRFARAGLEAAGKEAA